MRRILVVDDNQENLALYRDILAPDKPLASAAFTELESMFFAHKIVVEESVCFELALEADGEMAYRHLQEACLMGQPYDLAFVDMRMPGGWSGLETIAHLWLQKPDLPVVVCTAYSDYTWEEMTRLLGHRGQIKMLSKPFERQQVLSLAQYFGI